MVKVNGRRVLREVGQEFAEGWKGVEKVRESRRPRLIAIKRKGKAVVGKAAAVNGEIVYRNSKPYRRTVSPSAIPLATFEEPISIGELVTGLRFSQATQRRRQRR